MKTNDMITSEDLLVALNNWYVKYPEFQKNDLFIAGTSYSGIYVPFLSWQIYEYNLKQEMYNLT